MKQTTLHQAQNLKNPEMVWDLLTRLVHWSLAVIIILNLFVLEDGDEPHKILGYVACGLVALRTIWGFLAPQNNGEQAHARFANFPLHPRSVVGFATALFKSRGKSTPAYAGHNPFAALFSVALWLCILLLGLTGWMHGLDAFFGEDWVTETHEFLANTVQVLVCCHLLGIALDAKEKRRKTWLGMITGQRPAFHKLPDSIVPAKKS